jgi:hypothetical protein
MNDKLTWCKVKLPEEGQMQEYLFLCMPLKALAPHSMVHGDLSLQLQSALLQLMHVLFHCLDLAIHLLELELGPVSHLASNGVGYTVGTAGCVEATVGHTLSKKKLGWLQGGAG